MTIKNVGGKSHKKRFLVPDDESPSFFSAMSGEDLAACLGFIP